MHDPERDWRKYMRKIARMPNTDDMLAYLGKEFRRSVTARPPDPFKAAFGLAKVPRRAAERKDLAGPSSNVEGEPNEAGISSVGLSGSVRSDMHADDGFAGGAEQIPESLHDVRNASNSLHIAVNVAESVIVTDDAASGVHVASDASSVSAVSESGIPALSVEAYGGTMFPDNFSGTESRSTGLPTASHVGDSTSGIQSAVTSGIQSAVSPVSYVSSPSVAQVGATVLSEASVESTQHTGFARDPPAESRHPEPNSELPDVSPAVKSALGVKGSDTMQSAPHVAGSETGADSDPIGPPAESANGVMYGSANLAGRQDFMIGQNVGFDAGNAIHGGEHRHAAGVFARINIGTFDQESVAKPWGEGWDGWRRVGNDDITFAETRVAPAAGHGKYVKLSNEAAIGTVLGFEGGDATSEVSRDSNSPPDMRDSIAQITASLVNAVPRIEVEEELDEDDELEAHDWQDVSLYACASALSCACMTRTIKAHAVHAVSLCAYSTAYVNCVLPL